MTTIHIPFSSGRWVRNITDVHGVTGTAWLAALPDLLAVCAQRWSLTLLPAFPDLSYNYVAPALLPDGTPVVLKAGVPHSEFSGEIEALRWFAGEGSVRLLDADDTLAVSLQERLLPGSALQDLGDDDQITLTAAQVMQHLWKPAPTTHGFTTLTRWANGLKKLRNLFNGGYGPFPPELVDRAQGLFRELLSGDVEQTLIHGDMHAGNILLSERGWLAIDPKGVVGHPLYDVGNFVNDLSPLGDPIAERHATLRRANLLAEALGVDRREILSWALAHAVLSGWWSYEDHGAGWEWAFTRAAHTADLLDNHLSC